MPLFRSLAYFLCSFCLSRSFSLCCVFFANYLQIPFFSLFLPIELIEVPSKFIIYYQRRHGVLLCYLSQPEPNCHHPSPLIFYNMLPSNLIKREAKTTLSGHWTDAVVCTLVFLAIGLSIGALPIISIFAFW